MSSKHQRYADEMLGATGLVILGSFLPFELRRDIWATRVTEGMDASTFMLRAEAFLMERGARRFFAAKLDDVDAKVAARTAVRLEERLHELTGRVVSNLRPINSLYEVPEPAKVVPLPEDIPSYPCQARTDALEAAGVKQDPMYQRQGIA